MSKSLGKGRGHCSVFIPAIISLFNINKDSYIFLRATETTKGRETESDYHRNSPRPGGRRSDR